MSINCQSIIDKRRMLWNEHHDIEKDKEYTDSVADYAATNEDIINEILKNPEYLIEMVFVLVDKEQNTVPFFFNYVQRQFIDDLNHAIAEFNAGRRLHLKFLILKGRQQGFTQVITAYQLACSITRKNFSGITIANSKQNTEIVFQKKAKYLYDKLPLAVQPTTKFNNKKEFLFKTLNSGWIVGTAGDKDIGRSNTINFFHGSECALWDHIANIITGLGEALTRNSIQILESTGNGFNEYKDLWDGAGKNTWEAKFYYWYDSPEYTMSFESMEAKDNFIKRIDYGRGDSDSEIELMKKLKVLVNDVLIAKFGNESAWMKIYWYYQKWLGYVNKDEIKQEYPCNPMEAFLVSGRKRFDANILMEYANQCVEGNRGYLEQVGSEVKFVHDANGYLEVWKFPDKKEYFIGADVAKGLIHGDYSAAPVFDTNLDLCALWHGHIAPDLYAEELIKLGTWYNNALVAVEENNHGLTVLTCMKNSYFNLYKRTKVDKLSDEVKEELGWWSDEQSKRLAIDNLARLIREKKLGIKSKRFILECMSYVLDAKGATNASEGGYDDVVMGAAIGLMALSQNATMSFDVVSVNVNSSANNTNDHYVVQSNGYRKHISVIEDEENNDGWGWSD